MAAIAGRVMPIIKGQYNSEATYEPLDFVTYNNALWGCIKQTKGNAPTEGTYWKKAIDGNVSDAASLGGETAEQWQAKLDSIQTTSRATLSQAGWYRVAEYATTDENIAKGFASNSCELTIKQRADNTTGESIKLRLDSVLRKQSITAVSVKRHSTSYNAFTKCRYTYDSTGAYLEVYYSLSAMNVCLFVVDNPLDLVNTWKAITPTLTAETVDGVTVTTTYDIPSNATPVNSVDLANYLDKNIGGYIKGTVIVSKLMSIGEDSDTNAKEFNIRNSARRVQFYLDETGNLTFYDNTNKKQVFQTKADGTNTFNGTASGNLPLNGGGTVQAANSNPLKVKNTSGNDCYIPFVGKSGTLGYLGFSDINSLMFVTADAAAATVILHTGNSVRVVPATSAPSDTTVLWIDTANKKVKSYIDGAWTVIA